MRLPKAFRLPGTEVRVTKIGNKIILEPVEPPLFDVTAWRGRLRALGAVDFLPEGRPEEPPLPDDAPSFG